ncbi:MAG TPA: hypothetical protein PLL98_02830 [Bacillota bacterium]|nr:hypothetical protein [Bacillota bacterium]HOR85400.1 hypothetical protein [Bacillota bacterium]HPL53084.1 hypothetical protein [Bacillota bacterium]
MRVDNNNASDNGLDEVKKKISENLGGMDVNNMSSDQVKNMLVNEINRNTNIDPAIKDKINKGDVDGLKEDIIKYLTNNKSADGSSDQLINSLKSNDMEGLKKQLVAMLLSGLGPQKKNEMKEEQDVLETSESQAGEDVSKILPEEGLGGLDEKVLVNLLFDKMFAGVKDDRRILLMNSVKPFVSEKRQKGIDDCIKIMNLVAFFENFINKAGK